MICFRLKLSTSFWRCLSLSLSYDLPFSVMQASLDMFGFISIDVFHVSSFSLKFETLTSYSLVSTYLIGCHSNKIRKSDVLSLYDVFVFLSPVTLTPQAIQGPRRRAHRTSDCARRRISSAVISLLGRHRDDVALWSHVSICDHPSPSSDSKILSFH